MSPSPDPDRTSPAVRLVDAVRSYRGGASVGPLDLTVATGSAYGLVGSNGAGKTEARDRLLEPSSGRVEVWGGEVRGARPRGVGAMIEEPRFYPWLGATENLRAAAAGRDDWDAPVSPGV